jgi:exonuclease VII large subunit
MKKNWIKYGLIIGVVGIVALIIVATYMFNKPQRNIANEKAEFTISAAQLYNDFATNEQTANTKYLSEANGKVLQIEGIISEMVDGQDGNLVITLKDASMEGGISCTLVKDETAKAKKFKTGDKIVLKGECTGYIEITSEVDLIKCVVIEK